MVKLFGKLFDSNEKELKRLRPYVDEINALESEFQALTDDALKAKTAEFKKRYEQGESLDDLLPEAFAAVREAARRTIGQRHYDVQLIGGVTLHQGKIAEMKTGEGKTLVATLPLYLNSLAGYGAHLVTVNDYLARRDPYWMGPIYQALGVSVASIYPMQTPDEHTPARLYDPSYDSGKENGIWRHFRPISRAEAYQADITYGTSAEFGFDFLRDNMVVDLSRCVQRPLYYAIVDEVDNLLIDEARTPLIISGPAQDTGQLYKAVNDVVSRMSGEVRGFEPKSHNFQEQQELEELKNRVDYIAYEKEHYVETTARGQEKLARAFRMRAEELFGGESADEARGLSFEEARRLNDIQSVFRQSLNAHSLYKRDREYVVENGEIVIVDQFTGRKMYGRRYSEGLHQAIEAKEHVKVQRESLTYATITIQNYFRMYEKLAGMTGTAATEAEEFYKIYKLEVTEIPTNEPMIREDEPDFIYKTEEGKFRAVVSDIKQFHKEGIPVLIGTVSIEKSEILSGLLKRQGITCQVLNAKEHTREGEIIANAGRPGMVTVATNMAGRGVDIILGGYPPSGYRSYQDIYKYIFEQLNDLLPPIVGAEDTQQLVTKYEISAKEIDNKKNELKDALNQKVREIQELEKSNRIDTVALSELVEERKQIEKSLSETVLEYQNEFKQLLLDVKDTLKDSADKLVSLENQSLPILNEFIKWFERHIKVVSLGGLHIIGTERHEARRIDNQLRGRAGRQGDPGYSRFYISLEDDIMRRFGGDRLKTVMGWIGMDEDTPIENKMITGMITDVQKRVEGYHFDIRKNLVEYDDVVNKHRELIYDERRKILSGADLKTNILEYVRNEIADVLAAHPGGQFGENGDIAAMLKDVSRIMPLPRDVNAKTFEGKSEKDIEKNLAELSVSLYEQRERDLGPEKARLLERLVMLQVIDRLWVEHLTDMEHERLQAGWQTLRQMKSADAYKMSGHRRFGELTESIRHEVANVIFHVALTQRGEQPPQSPMAQADMGSKGDAKPRAPARVRGKKIGRNDPCPCGSGKKYKHCCGR
jgi:preprotein translocase subunit SecA